jgi:hypothetical protein
MTNRNDLNDRDFLRDHSASWRDIWTGLYLTLAVFAVVAALVFFTGPSSAPPVTEAANTATSGQLIGVRDPGRVGWRGANGPWNTLGTPEGTGSLDEVPDSEDETESAGPSRSGAAVAQKGRAPGRGGGPAPDCHHRIEGR